MANRTGKDSDRIIITISKEDRKRLQELADTEMRSLSNYCKCVLHEHVLAHPADSDADGKQG